MKFQPFLSRRKITLALDEFDQSAERLISRVFGESSEMLETYQYAKVGVRKLAGRAKGHLMWTRKLSEEEAFGLIRLRAWTCGNPFLILPGDSPRRRDRTAGG